MKEEFFLLSSLQLPALFVCSWHPLRVPAKNLNSGIAVHSFLGFERNRLGFSWRLKVPNALLLISHIQ